MDAERVVYLPPLLHPRVTWGGWSTDFSTRVHTMGIVNRTPDSFFDGGATYALERAVGAVVAAAEAGADWVDVGGVPFSPDTLEVGTEEEFGHVVPVVAGARAWTDVVLSVDTWRPEVARRAIEAGALVVNVTSGLRDPELADVVTAVDAALVITHSLAPPGAHLRRPRYDDVVDEVKAFLAERVQRACDRGVAEDRIVLDPGHDLNKNTRHSLELTRRLPEIADLGLLLLAAVSNKDFVGESTGLARSARLVPSVASAAACVLGGAASCGCTTSPRRLRRHGCSRPSSGCASRPGCGTTSTTTRGRSATTRDAPAAVRGHHYCGVRGGVEPGAGARRGPR